MKKSDFNFWVVMAFVTMMYSCAQPGPLTGGRKDTTPPQLIKESSTPNMQTKFKNQTIQFTFDEWIELKDAYNQIVISPPLQFQHEVSIKKKTVIFKFDEEEKLKEEATYTINFGEAVRDLTEGNAAENLRFVFSTGEFIDSLKVTGKIVDIENKPVTDVVLLLYDNLADSVVRTERPFYFARTNNSGTFSIENVKSDTFKVVALEDKNANYKFDDPVNERIGFLDEPVIISDSLSPLIEVQIFKEAQKVRLLKKDTSTHGMVKLIYSEKPLNQQIFHEQDSQKIKFTFEKDSINIWYDLTGIDRWNLYIKQDTITDTLTISNHRRNNFIENYKLIWKPTGQTDKPTDINPTKQIQIPFNHPLVNFDTSRIRLYEDSTKTVVFPHIHIDSIYPLQLNIKYGWKEKKIYQLDVLPGALIDLYGLMNTDSIQLNYVVKEKTDYGDITLTMTNIPDGKQFVLQLLDNNKKQIEEFIVANDSIVKRIFKSLPPGNYSLQIIEDLNKNGRWDTGNYDRREHPEKITIKQLEELRAGWELATTVTLDIFEIKKPIAQPKDINDAEQKEKTPINKNNEKNKRNK